MDRGRPQAYIGTTTGNVYIHDFPQTPAQPLPSYGSVSWSVQELSFGDQDGDGLTEVFTRAGSNAFYLEQERAGSSDFKILPAFSRKRFSMLTMWFR